jgi:membrane-associated phospholipid phosphatase
MDIITDFGDPAILLSVAAVLLIWFAAVGERSLALRWLAALGACAFGTGLVRFLLYIARPLDPDMPRIPSGHVSGSALVYGAVALVLAGSIADRRAKTAVAILAALFVAAIGASRVAVDAHTVGEVVAGLAVGIACLAWFAAGFLRRTAELRGGLIVASSIAVLGLALHGCKVQIWPMFEAVVNGLRAA